VCAVATYGGTRHRSWEVGAMAVLRRVSLLSLIFAWAGCVGGGGKMTVRSEHPCPANFLVLKYGRTAPHRKACSRSLQASSPVVCLFCPCPHLPLPIYIIAMSRTQPLCACLRPLAAPRASASRPLSRFSTATRLHLERMPVSASSCHTARY
jgi:hypothetical protein